MVLSHGGFAERLFLKDAVQNVLDLTTCMQLVCVSIVSYYTFHLKKMCTLICVEIECIKKAREGKVQM